MASVANSRRFIYINHIVRYSLREYPSRVGTVAGSPLVEGYTISLAPFRQK